MRTLTLIAGTNGAGKTQFFPYFMERGFLSAVPVNIDGLEKYIDNAKLPNDFFRYENARRKEIDRIFTDSCRYAIHQNLDFSYECNLRRDQLKNVALFDNAGYRLNLIFIWLDNEEISTQRVQKRVEEGGHFVGKESIRHNYREGLTNLDISYQDWNEVYVFDNSADIATNPHQIFTLLLHIKAGKFEYVSKQFLLKEKITEKLPNIYKAILAQEIEVKKGVTAEEKIRGKVVSPK